MSDEFRDPVSPPPSPAPGQNPAPAAPEPTISPREIPARAQPPDASAPFSPATPAGSTEGLPPESAPTTDTSTPETDPTTRADAVATPDAASTEPPPHYELLPPVIPVGEPPLIATPPSRFSAASVLAVLLGLVVCGLSILVINTSGEALTTPGAIGQFIGFVAFWPLVIVGLLSLSRRFRQPRARHVILACVWGLTALSQIGLLANRERVSSRTATPPPESMSEEPPTPGAPQPAAAPAKMAEAEARRLAAAFDFSPGSDTRLSQRIATAQVNAYAEIVQAYAAACQQRPRDAELALERLRFIERFAYAEDTEFPTASADLEVAKRYLFDRFPSDPGKLLHELQSTALDDFDGIADRIQSSVVRWPEEKQAQFWLLRAQHVDASDQRTIENYAASSFADRATPEAGLLLARAQIHGGRAAAAVKILAHDCFQSGTSWQQFERLKLLFDAGARTEALAAYEALKHSAPEIVRDTDLAQRLARAGHITLAREIFSAVPVNNWNRTKLAQERFDFELAHGNAAQASEAYRAMRAADFQSDTLGRRRLDLGLKHPSATWGAEEFGSAFLLSLLLLVFALLPLLLLVPVHYASLWRRLKGRTSEWRLTPWGLRSAYLVAAVCLVTLVSGLWYHQPALLQSWMDDQPELTETPVVHWPAMIGPLTLFWSAGALLCLGLVARARAWRLFGPGTWTIGRCCGIGFAAALAIKFATGIYIAIFGFTNLGIAEITPGSVKFFSLAYQHLGGFGLFALVAVFVPWFEETLFRGILLGALAKHLPFWAANTGQAIAFLLLHEEMRLAPFFLAVALVNGWLVRRSGGLLAALALHVTTNALAVFVIALQSGQLAR